MQQNKYRVLAVDDVKDTQDLLRDGLPMAASVRVDVAKSGTEALEWALKFRYDAIILDLAMPDLTGYQVAEKIRETNTRVPIIFFTGNVDTMTSARTTMIGNADVVTKPCGMDALWRRVLKMIKTPAP